MPASLAGRGRSPDEKFNTKEGRAVSVSDVKGKYKGRDVDWENEIGRMTPTSKERASSYI